MTREEEISAAADRAYPDVMEGGNIISHSAFVRGAEWADSNSRGLCPGIPSEIQVGGQKITVEMVDTIQDGLMGESLLCGSYIKIANNASGYKQTDESKLNTFIHECVHIILDNMGEKELSANERFVCTFAGFATEIIKSIKS